MAKEGDDYYNPNCKWGPTCRTKAIVIEGMERVYKEFLQGVVRVVGPAFEVVRPALKKGFNDAIGQLKKYKYKEEKVKRVDLKKYNLEDQNLEFKNLI